MDPTTQKNQIFKQLFSETILTDATYTSNNGLCHDCNFSCIQPFELEITCHNVMLFKEGCAYYTSASFDSLKHAMQISYKINL